MATRKQFCDAMNEVYKNHGVYIGTANGERTESLTIGQIHQMEKNYGRPDPDNDTKRDLRYIASCYEKHWNMSKSLVGDCSGIVVGILRSLKVIKFTADYNCRTFMKASKTVALKDLQAGDLVFNKASEPSHMGVYVGDGMVIDSRGRDVGVVKNKVSDYPWAVGGRLSWFSDEIPVLTRNLKYVPDNLMKGEDVKEAQIQLNKKGCDAGVEDGIFGRKTETATIEFQEINHPPLEVDGVIGQKTWEKLWE